MTIRAKFRCTSRKEQIGWSDNPLLWSYEFSPVPVPHSIEGHVLTEEEKQAHENYTFWKATPTGSIILTTVLINAFNVGESYYVDFSHAD